MREWSIMSPLRQALTLTVVAVLTARAASTPVRGNADGQHTASNICGSNATIGQAVVGSFNASYPGLEKFAMAVKAGDLGLACEELVEYYRTGSSGSWLRWVPPANFTRNSTRRVGGETDRILEDVYFLSGVTETAKIPRNADGGLDWYDTGPRKDVEFMNCLNRHDQWTKLMQAWHQTGNPIYTQHFNALVIDWVTHLPCRSGVSRAGWDAPGQFDKPCPTGTMESPWRVLEAGIRTVGPWASCFFGTLASGEVSTSARALMLLGFSEHVAVIAGPGREARTPNWQMTQWAGLITTCVAFPELQNATDYLNAAFDALTGLLNDQVYPDGMETELAFGYDMMTANDFLTAMELLNHTTSMAAPAAYRDRVEKMFEYGVYISDQRGFAPRNGDADLSRSGWSGTAHTLFGRNDWLYVHTAGKNGTRPAGDSPSVAFPWGGHVALKSSFDAGGLWAWFDFGKAYGSSGHAHRAKLSLTLRRNGTMLLVDSGRFAYQGTGLPVTLNREYERTTHAHNTLTLDGKEQLASPALTTVAVPPSEWAFAAESDYVRGAWSGWDGLEGNATHRRAVYHWREGGWLAVVDQVLSPTAPRHVQATWHAHPNATLTLDPTTLVTQVHGVDIEDTTRHGPGSCAVIPATGAAAARFGQASVVRGVVQNATTNTSWQGWYSQTYMGACPASTSVYTGVVPPAGSPTSPRRFSDGRGSGNDGGNLALGAGSFTFGWLITTSGTQGVPAEIGSMEIVAADAAGVQAVITVGGEARTLKLPFEAPASSASSSPRQHTLS